jgi:hypothetical protein
MKTSVASRFIDLAEPDRDTGKSAWVCFREYPELQTSNGSSWSRDDKLRCRNTDRWYLVEKKRRNDSPTGQIVAMRCVGIDLAPHDRNIPQGIFNQIKSMPCVETGATAEVDHKNGRYNADAKTLEEYGIGLQYCALTDLHLVFLEIWYRLNALPQKQEWAFDFILFSTSIFPLQLMQTYLEKGKFVTKTNRLNSAGRKCLQHTKLETALDHPFIKNIFIETNE